MKICPSCQTRYEEDILRFCIKDGSPLVQEEPPHPMEVPTSDLDEASAGVTIVRKTSARVNETEMDEDEGAVIHTSQRPRPRSTEPRRAAYQAPAPQPNIFKVVVLTVICTVAVLAGIVLVVWSLRGGSGTDANSNVDFNANVDTNLNTNLNMNGFNFNMNVNANKANVNANVNANANANVNVNANKANVNANVNTNTGRGNVNVNANTNANARPRPAANAANAGTSNRSANSNRPAANRPFDAANATRPRNVRP